MRLWQKIAQLPALLLSIAGFFGPDTIWNWVQPYIETEVARRAAILLGALALVPVYGRWLGDRLQQKPPAQFEKWDHVSNFAIWQIAWLWNDLEPQSPETIGTLVHPTFQRLEEHLASGMIADVPKVDGGWARSVVPRQTMVDYAYKSGERPRFLFESERQFWARAMSRFFSKELSSEEISGYFSIGDLRLQLSSQMPYQQVSEELLALLRVGKAHAIGRRKVNGIIYAYRKIPLRRWRKLKLGYSEASESNQSYTDLRVQFKKDKQQASQDQ